MKKSILFVNGLMAWFGVILQFVLILKNGAYSPLTNVINFFSFFTILSNILVALHYSVSFLKPDTNRFFIKPMVVAAIAMYITIVGITYNLILRSLWNPQGWQKAADETLHLITPLLFILYWLFLADKKGLNLKGIFSWMIFPIAYLIYTMLRGEFTDYYPYPFLDVGELGYSNVLMNCLYMTIGFFVVAWLFIVGGRILENTNRP